MSWLRFFHRARRDAELAKDIQFYLDTETEDNVARGMPKDVARERAYRKFGNTTLIREEVYRMNGMRFLETLWQDGLYAVRMIRRKPIFSAMVAATLALGIGANAAVFGIVQAVLLQPLPYKNPSRLVAIWDKNVRDSGISKMFDSFQDFREVTQHASSFEQVAAATWAVSGRLLSGQGFTQGVLAMPVSESFFPLLGVAPALGRTFVAEDSQRGCSVVLGDRLWRGRFAADPNIIGNSVSLDDQVCAVIGVMPPSFAFYPGATDMWILLTQNFSPPPDQLPIGIFARLRPGISIAQAQAELSALHAAVHRNDGKERDIVPIVHNLQEEFTFLADAGLKTTLWALLGAVTFVLLIACLNIANLLLGQAVAREHELALRVALGCGRRRILRQLLTEGLLLASIGGALGVGVAFVAIRYLHAVQPVEMPIGAHVEINWPVIAFTAAASVLTALLFGLLPAWRASRLDAIGSLKAGGRGSVSNRPRRLTQVLIAGEMALSLVLLVGAGLLMESVLKMDHEHLGFRPEGLAVTGVTLPANHYPDAASRLQFYDRVVSLLGDHTTALTTGLPPYVSASSVMHISNQPVSPESERHDVGQRIVSPEYFEVLRVRLLRGRTFNAHDQPSSEPVAVINDAIAREYFAGEDPIGKRICIGDPGEKNPWRTIVGVTADEKSSRNYRQIGWVELGNVFKPLAQDPPRSVSVVVRAAGADLQHRIANIDDRVAIGDTEMMEARFRRLLAYPRFRAVLLGAFAGFSLLLAAIGLYGVLGQFVGQRTQEIGVRMAVGATRGDVVRFIALQAGYPVTAGLAAGLLGAEAAVHYMGTLLYGVRPTDPGTLSIVSIALIVVAGIATLLPARRAARVDPLVALRND
jgi:putative ABC transport system permease protein